MTAAFSYSFEIGAANGALEKNVCQSPEDTGWYSKAGPNTELQNQEEAMSDEIKVDKVMDLKGLPCPMPVVKISKGIKEVEVGQVVEAITTDPGALADFPAWARTSGNEILKTEQNNGQITFFVKRKA